MQFLKIASATTYALLHFHSRKLPTNSGEPRVANMVMLGTLLEITGVLPQASVDAALNALVKHSRWLEIDERALARGRQLYHEWRAKE